MFSGVKMRLTISITSDNREAQSFSTEYNKWATAERPFLMQSLTYTQSLETNSASIPKTGSATETKIFEQLASFRKNDVPVEKHSAHGFYFHNAPIHWVRAFTFAPYFWSERDGEIISSHYKPVEAGSKEEAEAYISLLNSNLFYCWFVWNSNCRDLTIKEIESFPFSFQTCEKSTIQNLPQKCVELMKNYKSISEVIDVTYAATGAVRYEQIDTKRAKSAIDEIDRVLGQHFDLDPAQLDFVLNFQVKYRMGVRNMTQYVTKL
jgi:hypothetical protein